MLYGSVEYGLKNGKEVTVEWAGRAVLVEDKASGQSLIQDLQRETVLPVIAQMPKDDKLTRLASVSPMIEAGKLFLPRLGNWSQILQAELASFPNSGNDDMVEMVRPEEIRYFFAALEISCGVTWFIKR